MHQVCRAAGVPTPKFGRLSSHEDIEKLIKEVGFPVVLKPSAGAGSEGVFMASTLDEVYQRYEQIRYVYHHFLSLWLCKMVGLWQG